MPKISDDLFLVDTLFFRFSLSFFRFSISLLCEMLYNFMTFSSLEKPLNDFLMTPFFTLFGLPRASNNTTSQNIGGSGCMGRPPSNFGGDRPPRSPPMGRPISGQFV